YDVFIGISMSNWRFLYLDNKYGNRAVAKDNYIKLRERTYPTSGIAQVGIYHTGNYSNHIINNNVQGFGINSNVWAGIYSDNEGLELSSHNGNVIRVECNLTENIAIG